MARATALRHPEHIHPALWRASQLAGGRRRVLPTGHDALDHALADGGWPLGALIELLPLHTGIGELRLLQPALARLPSQGLILLLDPPHPPSMQCWANWGLQSRRLGYLQAGTAADRLWAAEQVLHHDACAALLCWIDHAPTPALLRLQRRAQACRLLLVLLRPPAAAGQASPAPLRLALDPTEKGLAVRVLKQRGPQLPQAIALDLYPDALDQPVPAPAALSGPPGSGHSPAALYPAPGPARGPHLAA